MLSRFTMRSIFGWTNQRCQLCQLPLASHETVWCQHCLSQLPQPPYCYHCGATTLNPTNGCGQCLTTPPPWQRLYRLGEYRPPLQQWIQNCKFSGQFWLAHQLGKQLAQHIPEPAPVLLPVPLHPRRRLWRSFNQSTALAWAIAEHTGSQVMPHGFRQIKPTQRQKQLTRRERQRNLQHAFALTEKNLPDHVAIVDDVVTTGSTAATLTKLLKSHGVQQIDIYCVCYTPMVK